MEKESIEVINEKQQKAVNDSLLTNVDGLNNYNSQKDKSKYFKINLFVDLVSLVFAFFLTSFLKHGEWRIYITTYINPFIFFSIIFILFSLLSQKYGNLRRLGFFRTVRLYMICLFFSFSVSVIAIYYLHLGAYSRFVVLGTILILAGLETIWLLIYYAFKESVLIKEDDEFERGKIKLEKYGPIIPAPFTTILEKESYFKNIEKIIIEETDRRVSNFLFSEVDLKPPHTAVLKTTTRFNINSLPDNFYNVIINLKRINDIKRINKFFESVNAKLNIGGIYINCVETYSIRKKRILKKFPKGINWIVYSIDFIFTRIAPKMPITRKIYFWITSGNNRILSMAETFGRLYSCGFEIIQDKQICGQLWFVARKIKDPVYDLNPTYGILIKLKRYGKNGKKIRVYKMRTMHAYAEYIQGYIFNKNDLQEGGKFKNDFRITTLGRFMRRFWIDELPTLINLFKGEMKLVGVRPLSKHYFNLYSEELKQKRNKFKPGLIPPFYVDLPKTMEEIMESEMKYLEAYEKHPFRTDWKYFWKAMKNIIFKKARSA